MTFTQKSLLMIAVAALTSTLTNAADRRVCFKLLIVDSRDECPLDATTGGRRPCQTVSSSTSKYSYAVGHKIELWDKDYTGDDEFIGMWLISGEGTQCATFPWEGASYAGTESQPDVYLKYINEVRGIAGGITVKAYTVSGAAYGNVTWRDGSSSDSDAYVAKDCASGATCTIAPTLTPTNDATSERGLRIMALDSAQHMLEVYGALMTEDVELRFPDPSWSYAYDRSTYYIFEDHGSDALTPAHELGHVLQMQLFGQDYLRDVCGSSHTVTGSEYESCATTEGWAEYVAAVAWYDPNNSATIPLYRGYNIETASTYDSTCADNGNIELQIMKAFWDLDDTINESGVSPASAYDDLVSYDSIAVAEGWRFFSNGTGNRDDYESDDDGVNMKDFYYNTTGWFTRSGVYETLLSHNCLNYQDFN